MGYVSSDGTPPDIVAPYAVVYVVIICFLGILGFLGLILFW